MVTTAYALLFCFTAACSTVKQDSLSAFLDQINGDRSAGLTWKQDELASVKALYPEDITPEELLTQEEIDALIAFRPMASELSIEQALSDADVFFRMLKAAYGGYPYFGGDEVFEPAKNEWMRRIREQGTAIDAGDLSALLEEGLSPIINDGHFGIDGQPLIIERHERLYYVPDLYFDDENAADIRYVKRTIKPGGELGYCLAAASVNGEDLPSSISLSGERIELHWVEAQNSLVNNQIAYLRTEIRGLTVMACHTLTANSNTKEQLNELMSAGRAYRGLNTFVIDLRGNEGGNSAYASAWIKSYSDKNPWYKSLDALNISHLFYAYAASHDSPYQEYLDSFRESRGTWRVNAYNGEQIDNDSVIFVLVDAKTASSGETFTRLLRLLENTVVVGSNTRGSSMFGNVCDFYLPFSGIAVTFGIKAGIVDCLSNTEGKGISPDLWVNPVDALKLVSELCKFYGVTD